MPGTEGAPNSALPLAAAGPVDPDLQQRDADGGDDRAGNDGREERQHRLKNGAIRIVNRPAPMTAPRMPGMPTRLAAIATIGPTAAKVTPIMTGRRMPNFQTPMLWIRVAMPQAKRSALIRNAICSWAACSAAPMISGTATAPAYMTSTCWRPSATSRRRRQSLVDGMDRLARALARRGERVGPASVMFGVPLQVSRLVRVKGQDRRGRRSPVLVRPQDLQTAQRRAEVRPGPRVPHRAGRRGTQPLDPVGGRSNPTRPIRGEKDAGKRRLGARVLERAGGRQ